MLSNPPLVAAHCRVIGVLEAVNKNGGGAFTVEDEQVFQAFALFCGLIVHNSNMAREIRRMELQGKVWSYQPHRALIVCLLMAEEQPSLHTQHHNYFTRSSCFLIPS